jgi:hypothetical protein
VSYFYKDLNANSKRTLPLSEGRFAAKCPLSPQKWRSPSSNRKERFAAIQKTEGKPCRDLDQGEANSTLIEYQGRISIMYAVGRRSAFQEAQRAFRSNRLSHEIGRRNLQSGKRLFSFVLNPISKRLAKLSEHQSPASFS